MTISVVCGLCAQAYEVDQAKYGGKKIKCKKCAAVIEVPREGDVDDFEVVEESAAKTVAPLAPAVPPDVLTRSRLVGLKSAVALSQLQREEASRAAIRHMIVQKHGDEKRRLAWRKPFESKVSKVLAEIRADEEHIAAFKGFLAKHGGSGGYFKAFGSEFQAMFEQAVKVLGAPVRPLPPGTDYGSRMTGLLVDGVLGVYTGRGLLWGKQQMEDKNKAIAEANAIVIETIQEAAKKLETGLLAKRESLESAVAARDMAFRQREEQDVADLQRMEESIGRGEYGEATSLGTKLLKRAPVSDVGVILVLLSRSAFHSGNQADAARLMQDAICFGMPAPGGMNAAYNDLWTKAEAGLPDETG